jgi:hypothetical protein
MSVIKNHFEVFLVQLVAKKTGNENVPNVNLVLSICQLMSTWQFLSNNFLKMSLNFDVRRFHTMKKL